MTTGRINQVTTFRMCMQPAEAYCVAQRHRTRTAVLSLAGVRHKENINAPTEYIRSQYTITFRRSVLSERAPATQTPCIPISHVPSQLSVFGMRTQITTFDEDYQQPAPTERRRTVTADPRVVICIRLGYQQLIHTPQQYKHTSQKDSV